MSMSEARKWAVGELGSIAARDEGIANRLVETAATLAENPGRTIPQACGSWAKTKAVYRLLDNESVSPEMILSSHREKTIERMKGHDVILAIQDTTHLVYGGPPGGGVGMNSTCPYSKGFLMYIIRAKEVDPPEEVGEGIDWLLLTTIPVNSLEDAMEKIRWYTLRWRIERFHHVLKSGCGIQELQPETADRLIGRLGGHLGRKHDGMPGTKTISRGLRRLEDISQA